MNRKLKAFGLVLVAALALTAVMASAASAQFTSNKSSTTLTGGQTGNHEFTAGSGFGAIKCETATFHGTQSGTNAETVTVKPTYGPTCKDSLGRVVHILHNSLEYHFTRTGPGVGNVIMTGTITLQVTGSTNCTVKIEGNQTLGGQTYHNNGGTNGVTVTTNTTGIHSTVEGNFFACGISGTYPITSTTGTYKGTTDIKGTVPGTEEAAEISVH